MSAINLRFGAEIEFITSSKAIQHKTWDGCASQLSKELKAASLENHVQPWQQMHPAEYTRWFIIKECTITNQPAQHQWGMELVSPIFDFRRPSVWKKDLEKIWRVLNTKFTTTTSQECAFQVHISPQSAPWSLPQVKAMAKAIAYFERSIDSLMPADRRCNRWCYSNRMNHFMRQHNLVGVFKVIEEATSIKVVASMMSFAAKDSVVATRIGKPGGTSHNRCRWNFISLVDENQGTIEFRQPPGATSASEATAWIQFTACFMQAALTLTLDPEKCSNVKKMGSMKIDELKSFVLLGARKTGLKDLRLLEGLFADKHMLPPAVFDLEDNTAATREAMNREARLARCSLEDLKRLSGYI